MTTIADNQRYPPLRDYAFIGDCHGAALVSRNGSVDWCCFGRFDAEPVCHRLLDYQNGGFFETNPLEDYHSSRRYLADTNILRTFFHTTAGQATITDFMPVGHRPGSDGESGSTALNAPCWLVRFIEGVQGHVRLRVRYRPSGAEFGKYPLTLHVTPKGVVSAEGPQLYSGLGFTLVDEVAETIVTLKAGNRYALILTPEPVANISVADDADRLLNITHAFWTEWLRHLRYQGPYRDAVSRSVLTLKLLTFAPTGAVAASPTTSLPEVLGGKRNWDYRYCWLRDATFTLYTLIALGYGGEGARFNAFLTRCLKETFPKVQIMYGVDGETELKERHLEHVEGYCQSQPVRIGNAAYTQRQVDIYGEMLNQAFLYQILDGPLEPGECQIFSELADHVAAHWQEPGHSIWEIRTQPRQYVYSKIMCWVALDRAIRLFGEKQPWCQARDAIYHAVLENGIAQNQNYLTQTFAGTELDAAVLLTPLLGFPIARSTFERTVDAIQATLSEDGYVKRYQTSDGLSGDEGAFVVCNFWLVDALLFLNRREEAMALYERLLSQTNDVGLLPEELNPKTQAFLGNFPLALSHIGLIRSALILDLYDAHHLKNEQVFTTDSARQTTDAMGGLLSSWVTCVDADSSSYDFSSASVLPDFWTG